MAAPHVTTASILSIFLPRISRPTIAATSRNTALYTRILSHRLLPNLAVALPVSLHLNLPGILSDIWDGILRAVPKRRTTHQKKRQRQMAGKALKDVTELNKCSACGAVKRAHILCPYCVEEIKSMFMRRNATKQPKLISIMRNRAKPTSKP